MEMLLLVGLPGSGKTTLCKEQFSNMERISQDVLGNKNAVIEKTIQCLQAGKSVIIDRTNITVAQRATFINLARDYSVSRIGCLLIYPNPEQSIDRIVERTNHETIPLSMPIEKKREIVYKFYKSYEEPGIEEGFDMILTMKDSRLKP